MGRGRPGFLSSCFTSNCSMQLSLCLLKPGVGSGDYAIRSLMSGIFIIIRYIEKANL